MNDDQMDEMLIQGVSDYNAPGEVPREEMWRRIQQARLEARRSAAASMIPVVDARGARWWMRPAVGIAATLILAAGIGIGSLLQRQPRTAATVAQAPTSTPSAAVTRGDSVVKPGTPDTSNVGVVRQLREVTKQTDARIRALAQANPGPDSRRAAGAAGGDAATGMAGAATPANQSLAYRLVVLQHLAGSEAMITSFRSGARSGQMDAELKTWSRELLGTTRLLESSQASNDPVMKRLLEDLDLVISQIVQYTSTGTANQEELDLIEQSINKRGVMSKLRSTIPSRNLPAGT